MFTDKSVGLGTSAPSSLMRSLMLNLLLLSTETQTTTDFRGEQNTFKSEESDYAADHSIRT